MPPRSESLSDELSTRLKEFLCPGKFGCQYSQCCRNHQERWAWEENQCDSYRQKQNACYEDNDSSRKGAFAFPQ
jgi:hypothetical protein